MNIYLIFTTKILVFIRWLHRFPQVVLIKELRMIIIFFQHTVQSLHCVYFWHMFLEPHQTTYHAIVSVLLGQGTELGTPTLGGYVFHFPTSYLLLLQSGARSKPIISLVLDGMCHVLHSQWSLSYSIPREIYRLALYVLEQT